MLQGSNAQSKMISISVGDLNCDDTTESSVPQNQAAPSGAPSALGNSRRLGKFSADGSKSMVIRSDTCTTRFEAQMVNKHFAVPLNH